MTVHDLAVDWVARLTKGKITHRRIGESPVYRPYPTRIEADVAARPDFFTSDHLHEVEVLHGLSKSKVTVYRKIKGEKTLWIVVPQGTRTLFKIRVIEGPDSFERFTELTLRKSAPEAPDEDEPVKDAGELET